MTWCVRIGKYSSNLRPLTTINPVPGRRRTRAIDSLRRPVVWINGLLTMLPLVLPTRLRARARLGALGQRPRDGLLRLVGMGRTAVHAQLLQHLAPERSLRQHAADREPDDLLRITREQM